MGSETMLIGALLCAVGVPLLLLGALHVTIRGWRGARDDGLGKARAVLHCSTSPLGPALATVREHA